MTYCVHFLCINVFDKKKKFFFIYYLLFNRYEIRDISNFLMYKIVVFIKLKYPCITIV